MPQNHGLNRRAFLRSAQMTALVGAVGTGASLAKAAAVDATGTPDGKYDFDTPYNRVGTDCTKWDSPMRTLKMDRIVAGMGIADMDFKCAPVITKALQERIQHEVWGYLDMPKAFNEASSLGTNGATASTSILTCWGSPPAFTPASLPR